MTRVHCAFFDETKPFDSWRQTTQKQINFLDDISEHFPMQNGYVIQPENKVSDFPVDPESLENLLKKTKIGYHKDAQVTTGTRAEGGQILINDPQQLVDQVFCAAMNCGQGYSGRINSRCLRAQERCKLILDSAYQGTYLAAIANGREHIVLTLIGGGVFGNPKSLIFSAILDAHLRWANVPASKLKKVSVVIYSDYDMYSSFPSILTQNKIPWQKASYVKGHRIVLESSK